MPIDGGVLELEMKMRDSGIDWFLGVDAASMWHGGQRLEVLWWATCLVSECLKNSSLDAFPIC